MQKFIISSILIISMLLLSSCSLIGSRLKMLNESNDDKKADARMEQIIKAIKNQDKEAFKKIFSKKVMDKADDFDSSVDNLFVFIQGKVDSWKTADGSLGVSESNDYGNKKKEVQSFYYVNTDKQKYFFSLEACTVDTKHPNNVGLYLLLVVKAEDEEKIYDKNQKILYDGDKKLSHAGIYIPIK